MTNSMNSHSDVHLKILDQKFWFRIVGQIDRSVSLLFEMNLRVPRTSCLELLRFKRWLTISKIWSGQSINLIEHLLALLTSWWSPKFAIHRRFDWIWFPIQNSSLNSFESEWRLEIWIFCNRKQIFLKRWSEKFAMWKLDRLKGSLINFVDLANSQIYIRKNSFTNFDMLGYPPDTSQFG